MPKLFFHLFMRSCLNAPPPPHHCFSVFPPLDIGVISKINQIRSDSKISYFYFIHFKINNLPIIYKIINNIKIKHSKL